MGHSLQVRLLTDASTGKAIAMRRGVGKVRHRETTKLWIQEKVHTGEFEVVKIGNRFNSADLCTKHLSQSEVAEIVEDMGHEWSEGRSEAAQQLVAHFSAVDLEDLIRYRCNIKC